MQGIAAMRKAPKYALQRCTKFIRALDEARAVPLVCTAK